LARDNTGLAWVHAVDGWADPDSVGLMLLAYPGARDQLSAAKYLNEIRQTLQAADQQPDPALGVIYAALDGVRANTLHAKDEAILANLGPAADSFSRENYDALKTAFGARLKSLLKDDAYNVKLADALDGLPLFGDDSLWSRFAENRKTVLAYAPGLPRCPASFVVYDGHAECMDMDRALAGEISGLTKTLLGFIDRDAATDVPTVRTAVDDVEIIFSDNYLQR
jgi:hypothetical protein